jgi:hypothetical protein
MSDKTNISTFNPLIPKENTLGLKSQDIPLPEDKLIFIHTDPTYDKDYKNDKNSKNAGRRRSSAKKHASRRKPRSAKKRATRRYRHRRRV